MKNGTILFVLMMAALPVYGQGYRSMSVWRDGKATEYSLLTLDSVEVAAGNGKAVVHYEKRGYTKLAADSVALADVDSITVSVPDVSSTNKRSVKELTLEFRSISAMGSPYKKIGNHNPLMGHKFGADPFGMVVGDRLYVYMTDDHIYNSSTGRPVPDSDYGDCKNVSIISTDDLVNWTDHGAQPVAGLGGGTGPAKWANNMWAPCAAHKTINGQEKFFLYFADNANGIGVLTADTPYGPWKQPSGMNQLISRNTPNCGNVTWLFDPAVLVDNDGNAYLYFGGGGSKYLYSYCSNWAQNADPGVANIAYMESDSPLGPFTYVGRCFDNPVGASWSGGGGNNHHSIVKYKGKYYILYHNRALKSAMMKENKDITGGMEVRSTCMNTISVNESTGRISNLSSSSISESGVNQLQDFDPYRVVPGPTMAWSKGVTTKYADSKCTAEMKTGAWMCLSNVNMGTGAIGFRARAKGKGIIAVTIGFAGPNGTALALIEVDSQSGYADLEVPLLKTASGLQTEFYITAVGDISLESWSLIKE